MTTNTDTCCPVCSTPWRSWGADERLLWFQSKEAGDRADQAEKAMVAALGDRWPEIQPLWEDCRQYESEQADIELSLLVARLKRYLPQYEDLLEWAHGIGIDYNDVYKPFYELKSVNA